MRPPDNLNIIQIYNPIIPLKPQKNYNFPVTVSYKSTSVPYAELHSEQKIRKDYHHFQKKRHP